MTKREERVVVKLYFNGRALTDKADKLKAWNVWEVWDIIAITET